MTVLQNQGHPNLIYPRKEVQCELMYFDTLSVAKEDFQRELGSISQNPCDLNLDLSYA